MLTAEPNHPIDRTRLSKMLGLPLERLLLRPADYLSSADIDVFTGVSVRNVDSAKKVCALSRLLVLLRCHDALSRWWN